MTNKKLAALEERLTEAHRTIAVLEAKYQALASDHADLKRLHDIQVKGNAVMFEFIRRRARVDVAIEPGTILDTLQKANR